MQVYSWRQTKNQEILKGRCAECLIKTILHVSDLLSTKKKVFFKLQPAEKLIVMAEEMPDHIVEGAHHNPQSCTISVLYNVCETFMMDLLRQMAFKERLSANSGTYLNLK